MSEQINFPIKQKSLRVIYDMSEETRIREAARMREKMLHDEASALYNAKQEGRAEGYAEGLAEGRAEWRAEIVKKMRSAGMTEEQIKSIIEE